MVFVPNLRAIQKISARVEIFGFVIRTSILRIGFPLSIHPKSVAGNRKATHIVILERMFDAKNRPFGCDPRSWRPFLERRQKDIQLHCGVNSWTCRTKNEHSH
jgi:hypothetical protein